MLTKVPNFSEGSELFLSNHLTRFIVSPKTRPVSSWKKNTSYSACPYWFSLGILLPKISRLIPPSRLSKAVVRLPFLLQAG